MPESYRPPCLEPGKEIEYLIDVNEGRIAAYVDEHSWSDFLYGNRDDFNFSLTRKDFALTSILVRAPLQAGEVKERRTLRAIRGIDVYECVRTEML